MNENMLFAIFTHERVAFINNNNNKILMLETKQMMLLLRLTKILGLQN